ncbi:hypothetical protein A2954_03265 [Candidatus Roizmanbacteria bacterium RIFCSPLOWO2_01_FULL_37_12]|uniref:Methyltransferase type 11 domain-containing protein n=1 Tax=Candidatus Roizmanbacteria bacterium RIFCSPLOWO2_01_FULL_37_12 TaxID=1802056 RepID=A0A1F7I7X7_9BACT|nr:MAG: hypothetical protein A2768_00260 [Candidatus Roizmanbacteria bacterium RIFCSPHIGHO2_01_FULL_37_16]OGK39471.1 MAG: hypothetical protein A2954_03265 [Candidatus Roizmanbacteria bacterium RIFCSPLOWO2_01_FULL_37_12]
MLNCKICNYKQIKFFHKIKIYSYYLCARCQTLFLTPIPSSSNIANFYKKNFQYPAGVTNEKLIRFRASVILKNLKKMNSNGKTLLDIGSGFGYFIDEAQKIDLKVTGIEPSKNLFSTLNKHLIKVEIKNLDFEQYYAQNTLKKFDFVTIIHTIEHVRNPKTIINKALKLLKPGGVLYIETPNLDSHLFRVEKYNYTFLTPPDHIWLFSKKSFHYILQDNLKIQIEKISSYSFPEHFMGILKYFFKKRILTGHPEFISGSESKKQMLKLVQHDKKRTLTSFKYLVVDKFFAPLLTPLLNLGIYGSILELYIRKK